MVEAQWGQAGDVFITNVVSAGAELVQRRIHINRVPEHDDVDFQTEGVELIFLVFAIAPPRRPALAVEPHAGKLMATLDAIKLHLDSPPVCLVLNVSKKVKRLHEPPHLLQRAGEFGWPVLGLQRADQTRRLDGAELDGARQSTIHLTTRRGGSQCRRR